MTIDLNCDMGESFGAYRIGEDEAMMSAITSANVACGFHAGDPLVMERTVCLAARHQVSVGAHPGYPDLQGFGRRNMDLSVEEIEAIVLYQVAALAGFARANRVELAHVKPHGALYNQAARDHGMATAVARAVARFSKDLILVGLAGSQLVEAGLEQGLRVANEAFPDRAYNPDGSLRSRKLPGAVLESPEEVVAHALTLVREGIPVSSGSQNTKIEVQTLCIHGDNPAAVKIARKLRAELFNANVEIAPLKQIV